MNINTSATSATAKLNESYDRFPYYSRAFRKTHPMHLATIAQLFGMSPPTVSQCRVLELGCASGGNLIPMAMALPNSQFLGIDLSAKQVKQGKAQIEELRLTNLQLVANNLTAIDESWGEFDYIIAHGVYSWVPETIREKILTICRNYLSPEGIAYISYNAYPGSHVREIVRELLLYATANDTSPQKKVETAKAIASEMASTCNSQNPYLTVFQKELKRLYDKHDSYVFHEYLEAINRPFYFHEFVNQAQKHHLQYLGDALFSEMFEHDLSLQAKEVLQKLTPNLITAEQYMDFFRNRRFRQTLLCHEEVSLDRNLKSEVVESMMISSNAQSNSDLDDFYNKTDVIFQTQKGNVLRSSSPVTKLGLSYLRQSYPQMMSFAQLWYRVQQDLGASEGRKQLAKDLLHGFSVNLVILSCHKVACQKEISIYPVALQIARQQIQSQSEVVNAYHDMVSMGELASQLLPYLDGTRDRAMLAKRFHLSLTTVEQILTELAQLGVLMQ